MPFILQTGSKRGTFKFGDKHPAEDRYFYCYRDRKEGLREHWLTMEGFDKFKNRINDRFVNDGDKVRESDRKSYKKHRAKRIAETREWQISNPEARKKICKRYYDANRDKLSCKAKLRERPRYKTRHYESRHRASKLGLLPDMTKVADRIIRNIYEARERVEQCLGIKFDVDHIVPLSLGGLHECKNLQIVPSSWNRKKHNRNSDRFEPSTI
jgi:5-methylcytosine-specific restriction endonuclease McrA